MTRSDDPSGSERKVALMLAGSRPLAVFNDVSFVDTGEDEIDRSFNRHVKNGRITYREERDVWPEPHEIGGRLAVASRLRLYVLPEETWRIEAYLHMIKASRGTPWNDALERLSRSLLGYTEQEINELLAKFHEERGDWGGIPAYAKVSAVNLEKLRQLGFKALPPDLADTLVLVLSERRPGKVLLDSLYQAGPCALIRFCLDTKFVLRCTREQVGDANILRAPAALLPELNLNLRSAIEVLQGSEV